MYQITVQNFSLTCQSEQTVLIWIDFLLDQGHAPKIIYKGANHEN